MDWNFPYPSKRTPLLAANCVATSQPLASQAGLAMLAKGGNAVDAAIAAAVALTVVEPVMNGIGGDAFAIVAEGGQLHGLNASGRAPRGWSLARFAGRDSMPALGWDAVTVPGAVSAWAGLHGKFGRLPFETLFEPAIGYARDGFLVTPVIAEMWREQAKTLRQFPGFAQTFLRDGRAPAAGEVFRCRDQAETLELIADSKGEAFYRGRIAERIAAAAKADGGALCLEDLAEHSADWVAPLGVDFKGYRIHELPPNGQGLAALIALGVLDRIDIDRLDPDGAEMQHLQIEATKLGMADVKAYVGDPQSMRVRAEELLTPGYLDERARGIDRTRAMAPQPGRPRQHGTVYLAAADSAGMMVSYIQSNYRGFGSGIVVPGTGVALNNRGNCFVLEPGGPNQVGPGKRPLQTIIPGFATKDGAPVAAFGVMGGVMQPQGHVQVGARLFALGQNPQAAVDAPRWRVEGDKVMIEAAWGQDFRAALADRGHDLLESPALGFGAAQVIWRLGAGGYVGASESRRDGQAVGF
ncbi:MAG TPA: gamma-glutamyltransferase family protein [Roseiarcus sp.]|nr:gamma-glutamyltransferase family protein [Roseiarcus sp.]